MRRHVGLAIVARRVIAASVCMGLLSTVCATAATTPPKKPPTTTGQPGKQGAGAAAFVNFCSSGLDSSNTDPAYVTLILEKLRIRAQQCAEAIRHVRGLIRESALAIDSCASSDKILAGFDQLGLPHEINLKIATANVVTLLKDYETVVAVTLDHDCVPLLAEGLAFGNTPQPLLFVANRPTVYVLLASGGPAPSAPGQTPSGPGSPKGGGGGGGGGSGSSASSNTDNPSALLLFMIAQRLQNSVCREKRGVEPTGAYVANSLPGVATVDNVPGRVGGTSGPCLFGSAGDSQNGPRYSVPSLAIVPEAQWNIEDFRNQCAGDPFIDTDANNNSVPAHGTVAGILLNGSITTKDGAFRVFSISGGSEAEFGAELVTCGGSPGSGGQPNNVSVWSDLISSGSKTHRLSMFPFALTGAIIGANLTAKSSYNQNPATLANAPTGTALAAAQSAFQQTNTSLAVGQSIGQFAQNFSTLTFGNPGSALTLRKTFEQWANEFNEHLIVFCEGNGHRAAPAGNRADLCGYLTTTQH